MNVIEHIDVESRPTKWLTDGLKNGTIEIDNSFQRRYVWVLKDKISLIETILMGFPIPEVYLWQTTTDPATGDTNYSIVDGQQRLGAVLSYINDDFKLSTSGLENKDSSYAGKLFSKLTDEQKSEIWKFKFSIRFIKEAVSKDSITKLFLRLNRTNTTLNPQELRNAEFNGLFIKLCEELSDNKFWTDFQIFNAGDLRRMLDIQFISTLLIFIRRGIEEETTQSAINKAYDQFNEVYQEYNSDKDLFIEIINVLSNLLRENENSIFIAKRKTHLYTLFTLSYYLLGTKKNTQEIKNISTKLNTWYFNYNNEKIFATESDNELLNEYKILSQEGVQKKPNRQRRLEILKSFLKI